MKNGEGFNWTAENVETLRSHALSGATAGEAGKIMGVSRSAALGKARRAGFHFNQAIRLAARAQAKPVTPKTMVLAPVVALPPAPPPVPSEGFSLMDLPAKGCRWPLEGSGPEIMLCGQPRREGDKVYCLRHRKLGSVAPATTASQLTRSLRKFSQ